MEDIKSKINGQTLHKISRLDDIIDRETQREDLVSADQFIQCSSLKMKKGLTFKPHKHVWKPGEELTIAQESWIVVRGSVRCFFYDLDASLLASPILRAGDASFTLEGGHTYEILEDNTIVYEYKTGPYKGQALDKEFL